MIDVKCEHCGYEWEYSGELLYATCPSCRTKTPTGVSPESDETDDAVPAEN